MSTDLKQCKESDKARDCIAEYAVQSLYRTAKQSKKTLTHLKKLIVLTNIMLVGCDSSYSPPNLPVGKLEIYYTGTNADKRCACTNSQGAYVINTSPQDRQFFWNIMTKDTLSGVQLKPINQNLVIPANTNKPGIFLGCTIHAVDTSCRFQASYSAGTVAVIKKQSSVNNVVFGVNSSPSISTCVQWCTNPNERNSGECLPLGVRYFKPIAPLTALVKQAQAGNGYITKEEVLKSYGASASDDKCNRGDIRTINGTIINEGETEHCTVSSEDLPSIIMKKIGLKDRSDLKLFGAIPKRIEATPVGTVRLNGITASDVIAFASMDYAPVLTFDGPKGKSLTDNFGGEVLGTTRIQLMGGKPQTIVATANGCISVNER
ncbi:MAG: hypothetical protein RSC75_12490 [Bacteroidales bacterium]|uniref:hypothetical protein n=1 Tax=Citrobacter freundii TaxID=546 RepID=UPI0015EAB24A|nr:hypothetical protein [Citrobacter freundii]QMJ04137.1 hypothetical protein HVY06_13830 [Citrobacter freundii]QMJ13205.1 hypothetical protein HVY04_13830 [Citrobacter freundii]